MVFVDTNVLMYAVGGEHPLRPEARAFFLESAEEGRPLATSAEVLQELLHAYLPVGRTGTLDAALRLAEGRIGTVWSVEEEDVRLARRLADRNPSLGARDVLHLACCRRRDVTRAKTFDRALASAFG
ncbi:MAG: type II toxin-antitoxin system VapC family toxin [Gemmatimonadota bacterium]